MRRLKFNLSKKFTVGYSVLMGLVIGISLLAYSHLEKTRILAKSIQQVHVPVSFLLKDFGSFYSQIKNTNQSLTHSESLIKKYTSLKKKLIELLVNHEQPTDKYQKMFTSFEYILNAQQIVKDDKYIIRQSTFKKANEIQDNLNQQNKDLEHLLDSLISRQEQQIAEVIADQERADKLLMIFLLLLLLTFIIGFATSLVLLRSSILSPIASLKDKIRDISLGKPVKVNLKKRNDEIGDIERVISNLIEGLDSRTSFAIAIGKGNYDNTLELRSDGDTMGKALIEMRENLKQNAKDEKQRNWTVTGLARFAEIIRNQNDLEQLADSIICEMVKYTNSNQGALFIVDDEDEENPCLKLMGCYAWDKKRFVDKQIRPGEGLTGECWLEGEPIFITQVPKDYVNITSGLGYATPGCVFISPLKVNDKIYGVLELATFTPYQEYEREFITKVSENIASAIFNAKINEQTQKLLKLSQQQTEEMRASEEELRQNMEELQATQETAERRNRELERMSSQAEAQKQMLAKSLQKLKQKEQESHEQLEQLQATQKEKERISNINAQIFEQATDAVITIDADKKILTFNKASEEMFGYGRKEVLGKNVKIVVPQEHRKTHDGYVDRNIKTGDNKLIGKSRELEMTRKDGSRFWGLLTLSKVEANGEIRFTAFIKDVSDRILREKANQEQAEELYQNLEELKTKQRGNGMRNPGEEKDQELKS